MKNSLRHATTILVISAFAVAAVGSGANLDAKVQTPCEAAAECDATREDARHAYEKCSAGGQTNCESERNVVMMAEIREWRFQKSTLGKACHDGDNAACDQLNVIADGNLHRFFGMADWLRWQTVDRPREWQVSQDEFRSSAVEACVLACTRGHNERCCRYIAEAGEAKAAARDRQLQIEGCSRACGAKCDECGAVPAACEGKLQECLNSCGEHMLMHCRGWNGM